MYPKLLLELIDYFKKFPGVGEKSAERMALALLEFKIEDIEGFSTSMVLAKKNIVNCSICGALCDDDVCDICKSEARIDNLICVIEDFRSLVAFEKTGKFNGKYHILNGLISPIDDIGPENINIIPLIERVKKFENVEVIVALKPSIEGETTTLYLKKVLEKYPGVKITRLSYGIPMGVDIDYLDEMTLLNALNERKNIT